MTTEKRQKRLAPVLEVFTQHPNQELHINDIAQMSGQPLDKVINAISAGRARNPELRKRIDIVAPATVYRYRNGPVDEPKEEPKEEPKLSEELFVEVGRTPRGTMLVRGEDGVLYVLNELDI